MTCLQEIGNKASKSKNHFHWLIGISLSQLTNQNLLTNGTLTSGLQVNLLRQFHHPALPLASRRREHLVCPFSVLEGQEGTFKRKKQQWHCI